MIYLFCITLFFQPLFMIFIFLLMGLVHFVDRFVNLKIEWSCLMIRAMAADSSQPARGPWSVTLHPYVHRKFMEYCPERRLR